MMRPVRSAPDARLSLPGYGHWRDHLDLTVQSLPCGTLTSVNGCGGHATASRHYVDVTQTPGPIYAALLSRCIHLHDVTDVFVQIIAQIIARETERNSGLQKA